MIPSSGQCPPRPCGIVEPVALAHRLQNMAAVGEPVERRPGEPFASENPGPVLEGKVLRDDQAVAFKVRRDDVEEQFRPHLARRHGAEPVTSMDAGTSSSSTTSKLSASGFYRKAAA